MNDDVKNDYLGHSLFNDILAAPLRIKNRGVVLANMIEEGQVGDSIKHDATAKIIGYFGCVPDAEKSAVLASMNAALADRGISITKVSMH